MCYRPINHRGKSPEGDHWGEIIGGVHLSENLSWIVAHFLCTIVICITLTQLPIVCVYNFYFLFSDIGAYALSLRSESEIYEVEIRHYKIRVVDKGVCYIDADSNVKPFSNITELITYYTGNFYPCFSFLPSSSSLLSLSSSLPPSYQLQTGLGNTIDNLQRSSTQSRSKPLPHTCSNHHCA